MTRPHLELIVEHALLASRYSHIQPRFLPETGTNSRRAAADRRASFVSSSIVSQLMLIPRSTCPGQRTTLACLAAISRGIIAAPAQLTLAVQHLRSTGVPPFGFELSSNGYRRSRHLTLTPIGRTAHHVPKGLLLRDDRGVRLWPRDDVHRLGQPDLGLVIPLTGERLERSPGMV